MNNVIRMARGKILSILDPGGNRRHKEKDNIIIDTLLEDLVIFKDKIEGAGDYSIEFTAEYGKLQETDRIKIELEKMRRPFDSGYLLEKVVKLGIERKISWDEKNNGTIMKEYENALKCIKEEKRKDDKWKEEKAIDKKLSGGVLINLTDKPIKKELTEYFEMGGKWIGEILIDDVDVFKRSQYTNILNTMYGNWFKENPLLLRNDPILKNKQHFEEEHLEKSIVDCMKIPGIGVEDVDFFKNILVDLDTIKKKEKKGKEGDVSLIDDNMTLVEADKKQGICLLYMSDMLKIYDRANEQQGYILTDLTEKELVRDGLIRRDRLKSIMPKEVEKRLTKKLEKQLNMPGGMAAIQRPLLKVHKHKVPNFDIINDMKARFVKSSSGAPVNVIAEILSRETKPMIDTLNKEMEDNFGFKPSVQDCEETFKKLSEIQIKNMGCLVVGLEADVEDMYPSMAHEVVMGDMEEILQHFGKSEEYKTFYMNSLDDIMKINYFIQPKGIFTNGRKGAKGFAIGCLYSADGSEIIMVWRERRAVEKLFNRDLMRFVKVWMRYKDDFLIVLEYHPTKTFEIMETICEVFPDCLKLKFKMSFSRVDFLDQSLYINNWDEDECNNFGSYVKMLRKKEAAYDIPRSGTNMEESIKIGTIYCYVRRAMKRNSEDRDKLWNEKLYMKILGCRGFGETRYKRLKRKILKRWENKEIEGTRGKKPAEEKESKKYAGGTIFDNRTKIHKKISRDIQANKIPSRFSNPITLPGKSRWKNQFTKKKFNQRLRDFNEKMANK